MFKLKETDKSVYENALEAKERFNDVIANVKELKKGEVVINSKDADVIKTFFSFKSVFVN